METTQECYVLFRKNPGSNTPQNSNCAATYLSSHKPSKKDEQDLRSTAGEIKTKTTATFSHEPLHMAVPVLVGQQEFTSSL